MQSHFIVQLPHRKPVKQLLRGSECPHSSLLKVCRCHYTSVNKRLLNVFFKGVKTVIVGLPLNFEVVRNGDNF